MRAGPGSASSSEFRFRLRVVIHLNNRFAPVCRFDLELDAFYVQRETELSLKKLPSNVRDRCRLLVLSSD